MKTSALIALDLDRLRRLNIGQVSITNQTTTEIKYEIKLADAADPSKVIEVTGKVQHLFGPRLLSSGSHADEHNGNCVTARVCLQSTQLYKNEPTMASVQSFLQRAKSSTPTKLTTFTVDKKRLAKLCDQIETMPGHGVNVLLANEDFDSTASDRYIL